jgi:hypothetical protein
LPFDGAGFDALMDASLFSDLERMVGLFSRVGALGQLRTAFSCYVKRVGGALIQADDRDKELIDDLLAFKSRLDACLDVAFGKREEFVHALKVALF